MYFCKKAISMKTYFLPTIFLLILTGINTQLGIAQSSTSEEVAIETTQSTHNGPRFEVKYIVVETSNEGESNITFPDFTDEITVSITNELGETNYFIINNTHSSIHIPISWRGEILITIIDQEGIIYEGTIYI